MSVQRASTEGVSHPSRGIRVLTGSNGLGVTAGVAASAAKETYLIAARRRWGRLVASEEGGGARSSDNGRMNFSFNQPERGAEATLS